MINKKENVKSTSNKKNELNLIILFDKRIDDATINIQKHLIQYSSEYPSGANNSILIETKNNSTRTKKSREFIVLLLNNNLI